MSELINTNDNRATIRWKLLTGVSALALSAYVSSVNVARAEDSDRPPLWIEFGGQMDLLQGTSGLFIAPFMTALSPTPGVYSDDILTKGQKASRFSFGGEGKISFQPKGSDWILSASIHYGRANNNKHIHHQSAYPLGSFLTHTVAFADIKSSYDEHHATLDFSAGKDVGLGKFGRDGSSTLSLGVEVDEFSSKNHVDMLARPVIHILRDHQHFPVPTFYAYTMVAHADRSFQAVGPTLSWDASAALAGNKSTGEIALDWGVNGALLFGRQRTKLNHATRAYLQPFTNYVTYVGYYYTKVYDHSHSANRSRRVMVPMLGGYAGLSWHTDHAKVSIGYRYDAYLHAMDTGIDAAKKSNVTFNGPYASISIGLGD